MFARVRPPLSTEPRTQHPSGAPVVSFPSAIDPNQDAVAVQVTDGVNGFGERSQGAAGKNVFEFDKVFGEGAGQDEVFEEISQLV